MSLVRTRSAEAALEGGAPTTTDVRRDTTFADGRTDLLRAGLAPFFDPAFGRFPFKRIDLAAGAARRPVFFVGLDLAFDFAIDAATYTNYAS
jgi:hypothetical protein